MNLRPPGYEPGELPDCSTPRRYAKNTIDSVPVLLWIALGLFAVVLVGAGSFTAVRAARAWRDVHKVGDTLTAAVTVVASRAATVEARVEHLRERAEPVQRATGALKRDLDTLNVLVDELRALEAKVAPIRDLVPTK